MKNQYWFKNLFQFNTIDDVLSKCEQHGVNCHPVYRHKEKNPYPNLYILNYDQLASSGSDYFARFCRGLLIDASDLSVVCRPFNRFFNYCEQFTDDLLQQALIEKRDVQIFDKVDGSILKFFFYPQANTWMLHTRGSFGENNTRIGEYSYTQLFAYIVDGRSKQDPKPTPQEAEQIINDFANKEGLDKNTTYLFELMSPYNENVVFAKKTRIYFLGANHNHVDDNLKIFDTTKLAEMKKEERPPAMLEILDNQNQYGLGTIALPNVQFFKNEHIDYPMSHNMTNIDELINIVNMMKGREEEGFVVYIDGMPSVKLKAPEYVELHLVLGNNNFLADTGAAIVYAGEEAEYIATFPDRKDVLQPYVDARDDLYALAKDSFYATLNYLETINPDFKKENVINKLTFDPNMSVIEHNKQFVIHIFDTIELKKEHRHPLAVFFGTAPKTEKFTIQINDILNNPLLNNPFVLKAISSIMFSILGGKSVRETIIKMVDKTKIGILTNIMASKGINYRDFEWRNHGAKLQDQSSNQTDTNNNTETNNQS